MERGLGPDVARPVIDREVALIDSAMRLVASGAATRALVAGLRMADVAALIAGRNAAGSGVIVEIVDGFDARGRDVIVRSARAPLRS